MTMKEKVDTKIQVEAVMQECRTLFEKKLHDYGASWRILRTQSLTDQIFIKAKRIRSLEIKGVALVDEGLRPEVIGIIKYGVVGLMELGRGVSDKGEVTNEEALQLYEKWANEAKQLMR